jgi:magnesium chelatase family protein
VARGRATLATLEAQVRDPASATRLALESDVLARSFTAAIQGVDGSVVTVEADARLGLPGLTVVGRASGAVIEARERVRGALAHCGHELRPRKQVVNLAPADLRKDSPGIDLAVAAALLGSHEIVAPRALDDVLLWGELGLDGRVRAAAGTLVVADCARRKGFAAVVVAQESADEAALIPGLTVLPVSSLDRLIAHLRGERSIEAHARDGPTAPLPASGPDMADVVGLPTGRLAVEVMIAGGHNLLLHGPPGVGKTMLARRAAALVPELDDEAALEVTKIHSVAKGRIGETLHRRPPIRMPHHTVSAAGLLGGGTPTRPGEVEGLREPLEDGTVTIVRASGVVRFPARFQLMAAMNPCPCGFHGHPDRACVDPPAVVARYRRKLSGPLLDRIDHVVPIAPSRVSLDGEGGESSAAIRDRIAATRARQRERLADTPWRTNAEIPADAGAIDRFCALAPAARRMLADLARVRRLSPRAQHRLRRVARTIADLGDPDGAPERALGEEDVARAAALRCLPE